MAIPCCNPCITCVPTAARDGRNIIDPDPLDPSNPFLNLSSEAPDVDVFIGRKYAPPNPPPLNSLWLANSCLGICVSSKSQADADLCAQQANMLCLSGKWPVPGPNPGPPPPPGFPPRPPMIPTNRQLFGNTPQSCIFFCDALSPTEFIVPAGTFFAFNQASANNQAHAYACAQSVITRVCAGDLFPEVACLGSAYEGEIDVTTGTGFFAVSLQSGALPTGLFLSQTPTGVLISGTPAVTGTFTFVLHVDDGAGHSVNKSYTIEIEGIITGSALPAGIVSNFYSQMIAAGNTDGSVTWAVTAGSLPPGVALNVNTGIISGTPTLAGSYFFTVTSNDSR